MIKNKNFLQESKADNYHKNWIFKWRGESRENINLPYFRDISNLLDEITAEGIFKLEFRCKTESMQYYCEEFNLKTDLSKEDLIKVLSSINNTKNLMLEPQTIETTNFSYVTKLPSVQKGWVFGKNYKNKKLS